VLASKKDKGDAMNIIQSLDISILSLEDTYTKLNDAVLTAEKGRGESE
jgi:hypothetical protein